MHKFFVRDETIYSSFSCAEILRCGCIQDKHVCEIAGVRRSHNFVIANPVPRAP